MFVTKTGMSIKYVLFDTDGVIVNSSEMFSKKLARENNIPDEDIFPFFKEIFIPKCMIGAADLKQEVVSWLPKWKWKGTVDELLQYWFKSEHNINTKVTEYISSLREKGIKCYLATNQEKYRTQYLKKEMGFAELFDGVFSSAELGCKKPSLEFYSKVFDKLSQDTKVTKEEILYIDDEEPNIEAAKQFGFNVIHFKSIKDLQRL